MYGASLCLLLLCFIIFSFVMFFYPFFFHSFFSMTIIRVHVNRKRKEKTKQNKKTRKKCFVFSMHFPNLGASNGPMPMTKHPEALRLEMFRVRRRTSVWISSTVKSCRHNTSYHHAYSLIALVILMPLYEHFSCTGHSRQQTIYLFVVGWNFDLGGTNLCIVVTKNADSFSAFVWIYFSFHG